MLDRFEAAAQALRDAVVRTEPGVVAFHAVAEVGHPGRIHVLEIYDDADACRLHAQSSHVLAFRAATDSLVAKRRLHDVVYAGWPNAMSTIGRLREQPAPGSGEKA